MIEETAFEAMQKHNQLWGEMIDKNVAELKAKGNDLQ